MKEINLSGLSVTELKALVYDLIADVEHAQRSIKVINQEIINRANAQAQEEKPKTEKPDLKAV